MVDLNTGQPFGYERGTTFVVSGQGQYNDLVEEVAPRVAALFAYHDPDDVWAMSLSAAYSDDTTLELGQNTVRWQQPGVNLEQGRYGFRSVGGVNCSQIQSDTGCLDVLNGFHPRIPRYGEIKVERERLGVTGSIEFRPSEDTRISLDVLHSKLDAVRGEKWLEVLFRGNEGDMDVVDYTSTVDQQRDLDAGRQRLGAHRELREGLDHHVRPVDRQPRTRVQRRTDRARDGGQRAVGTRVPVRDHLHVRRPRLQRLRLRLQRRRAAADRVQRRRRQRPGEFPDVGIPRPAQQHHAQVRHPRR